MKKITLIAMALVIVCSMVSCNKSNTDNTTAEISKINQKTYAKIYKTDGIQNFNKYDGPSEINVDILPSDDFIETFKCVDSQYFYRECYDGWWDTLADEKSVVVFRYDENNYNAAKAFCLNEMNLSDTYTLAYNGYVFKENIATAIRYDAYSDDGVHSFPQRFNMVAYNDELNTIVFFGCYFSGYSNDDAMLIVSQWGEFLNAHFSDMYNFGDKTGDGSKSLKKSD